MLIHQSRIAEKTLVSVGSHLNLNPGNYFVATKVSSGYLGTGNISHVRFISHIHHYELGNTIPRKH